MNDEDIELEYVYLVAFNSIIDTSDPANPSAIVDYEYFANLGLQTDIFNHQIAPEEFPLEKDVGMHYSRIQMINRFNPHRHIRAYVITAAIDPDTMYNWIREMPGEAEKMIKEKGNKLF